MHKRSIKFIVTLVIVILIAVYHRELLVMVRIWQPTLFGCELISESMCVQENMSHEQRKDLQSNLEISTNRLRQLFGRLESTPKLIVCMDETCFRKYGGISEKAKAYGYSAIVLSPRGYSAAFLTHELFHAEFAQRLGISKLLLTGEIPRWFNEGMAVYVSQDSRYNQKSWCAGTNNGKDAPGLDDLVESKDWLAVTRRGDIYSYGTAREEVSNWIEHVGPGALNLLVKRIKAGEAFLTVYTELGSVPGTFLPRVTSMQVNHNCLAYTKGEVK